MCLRNARALAVMTMFRLGMSYEEKVAALGLVSQIELALIACLRESVPEPGQTWDGHRRAREIERRLARLRWVEHEQEKERRGVRGMWNWLVGKEQLSGKMLFDKMLAAMNSNPSNDLIRRRCGSRAATGCWATALSRERFGGAEGRGVPVGKTVQNFRKI